ncbi:hypothetical protein [Moorena sp. SIO3H5]|nr:hypothetical protein [Moorena sp. SIO3H5]
MSLVSKHNTQTIAMVRVECPVLTVDRQRLTINSQPSTSDRLLG